MYSDDRARVQNMQPYLVVRKGTGLQLYTPYYYGNRFRNNGYIQLHGEIKYFDFKIIYSM
jgi:hypothetical protein